MLTVNQVIKASAMIDKMGLEIKNPKATQEELGADLILQIASKTHKAGEEVKVFVADVKKCSLEEAGEVDVIELLKEKLNDSGFISFFKNAVKSKLQG